jgi:spermidine synthase
VGSERWILMPDPENTTIYGIRGKLIASIMSKFQIIEVMDTAAFGRCLFLDSKIQSAERDEFIYHEILVHPAMFIHPCPKRIFIAGGGEGATLREVLKHNTVEKVVMVDLDPEVVKVARKYLGSWHMDVFEDKRVEIIFDDARSYLEKTDQKFDVIILDTTEPMEDRSSRFLFTHEFYSLLKQRLEDKGLVSTQAGSGSILELSCFSNVFKTLKAIFKWALPYWTFVPSFFTMWGFVVVSDSLSLRAITEEKIRTRMEERRLSELKYYSPGIHKACFEIPTYLRKALEEEGREIYDKKPLVY